MERGNPTQSVAALKEAAGLLRQGYSMVIFPEGTRSRGDQVGPFKTGAFRVASMTGTPIVPLCIDGSYRVMEAHGFWIHPAKVRIKLLPPVQTKGLSREEIHALDERVRQIIVDEKSAWAEG